ncbi:MAG: hypothetical protein N3G77_07925 [Nitrososphaeria archaeon]|nr:hypothetical protein [Nitrososphaeria archaeon]MDW7987061.1 hypothetical protein [Nitrososphaerota archaeon]
MQPPTLAVIYVRVPTMLVVIKIYNTVASGCWRIEYFGSGFDIY